MKRILAYLLPAILLFSCTEKSKMNFTISGKAGDEQCMLYLFGTDSRYERIDSFESEDNGEFHFGMETDTIIPLLLLLPEGELVPVYAEPDVEAFLKKDKYMKSGWCVDGGRTQVLHDSISRELDACKGDNQRMKMIEDFVDAHPISDVNIEIMRRYMIDIKNPKSEKIRSRIASMGGIMQDQEFFASVKRRVEHKRSNILNRSFPAFNYTTAEGKKVTLSDYILRYTLVTFWASWNEESRKSMQALREIYEKADTSGLAILNIALEHDTAKWRECIVSDSIVGDNVYDLRGWNSELIQEFTIPSIPYSILINPYQRVNEYGVQLDGAAERLDSLVKVHRKKEKEKELKKKKRR